jgi:hypothetical protein
MMDRKLNLCRQMANEWRNFSSAYNNVFQILCENALKIKIGQAEITRQAMNISA